MKMELTAREIRLLKVLVTALITVLMIQFLVIPAVETHQELTIKQEETEAKRAQMQNSIDRIETSREIAAKIREELKKESEVYYEKMEPREVDEIVTGLAYRHSLFPARLEIGQRTEGKAAPYVYSKKGEEQQKSPQSAGNTDGKEPKSYLQSVAASITLSGTNENILAFLNDVETNYPSIQVRQFRIQRASFMNASMNPVEETKTNLMLSVYMRDQGAEEQ